MLNRKSLTLKKKIELIKDSQNGYGLSVRELANKYGVSKSSAANILHRREEFLSDYTSNCNKGIKGKHKDENGQTINKIAFEWFTLQRVKQIPISGPILQEKAKQVAEHLEYSSDTFKASNDWLEKFRIRHAISFRTISDESASINNFTIEEWTNRLSTILDGFNENDVFNVDENALFYRAIPDRALVLSKEECKGGKKSKERLTILLCSNWSETEQMKPIVIGKSQRPWCFKNISTFKLPVIWLANRTAWMTSNIFSDWLTTINTQMKKNNRKILLILDNASCHVINKDLSNIKLVFFPPNTTSICQPLDQGTIKSFKCYYRQKLARHIITQCIIARTAAEISISASDAVEWIDSSWKDVTEITIQNGFRAAGFAHSSSTSTSSTIDMDTTTEADLYSNNIDDCVQQLDSLLAHVQIGGQHLTATEFIDIDECIPAFNEWNEGRFPKTRFLVIEPAK